MIEEMPRRKNMRKLSVYVLVAAVMLVAAVTAEATVTASSTAAAKSEPVCIDIAQCYAPIEDQSGTIIASVETQQNGSQVTVDYVAELGYYITEVYLLVEYTPEGGDTEEVFKKLEVLDPPAETHQITFDAGVGRTGECLSFTTFIQFNDTLVTDDELADLELPTEVTMKVQYPGTGGDPSYFDTTVTGGTILDGTYEGWCVDTSRSISSGTEFTAAVYSSYDGTIPAGLVDKPENFDLVNWIINQDFPGQPSSCGGNYTFGDVQRAIWELIDDHPDDGNGATFDSCRVAEIKAKAFEGGEGYVPQCGQTVAVILAPTSGTNQVIIAQVTVIDFPIGCNVEQLSKTLTICCCLEGQTIELEKIWDGEAGDTTLTITDEAGNVIATADAFGAYATTGTQKVLAKTYFLNETDPGAEYEGTLSCIDQVDGYELTVGGDNSVEVAAGAEVLCTFTNSLKKGRIIVKKVTDPIDSEQLFTFSPSYGDRFELMGGEQNDSGELDSGSYSVSEDMPLPFGWEQTRATCDDDSNPSQIELGPGEVVTCTFVNTFVGVQGCTYTQGYWKTHANPARKQYDDTWDNIRPSTGFYLSGQTYLQVMKAPTKGNVYYILAQQFIAAKLNSYIASVPPNVAAAIAAAETFFGTYTPAEAADLKGMERETFITLSELLDSYNNGYEGVPHCD
jgi:hypothetical protein